MIKLSRTNLKNVLGGNFPPASCTADCGAGVTVTCSGSSCGATDYQGCTGTTTNSSGEVVHDDKPCYYA